MKNSFLGMVGNRCVACASMGASGILEVRKDTPQHIYKIGKSWHPYEPVVTSLWCSTCEAECIVEDTYDASFAAAEAIVCRGLFEEQGITSVELAKFRKAFKGISEQAPDDTYKLIAFLRRH